MGEVRLRGFLAGFSFGDDGFDEGFDVVPSCFLVEGEVDEGKADESAEFFAVDGVVQGFKAGDSRERKCDHDNKR
jgi:hypothetical protein